MIPATAAAALHRAARRKTRTLPSLWLMTDPARLSDTLRAAARLPRGSGVILRHYGEGGRPRLAQKLAALCRGRGLVFLVAEDWRLAAAVKADGLHLPERAARNPPPGARLWRRAGKRILTAAAHGANGLARAARIEADAALLSPVFATASHPGAPALGAARFAAMVKRTPVPVIALGGITRATVRRLVASGCAGVAGIGFAVNG